MSRTVGLRQAYVAAFLTHLADPDERTLYAAWELGRDAMVSGVGVMELAEAHHDALVAGLRKEPDVFATTRAARDFLLESLSAYEMERRGISEARAEAEGERRRAAIVRRLSSFFADASLSVRGSDSVHEILHLLAEQARELVGGACCVATLAATDGAPDARAASYADAEAAWGARLAIGDLSPLEERLRVETSVRADPRGVAGDGANGSGPTARSWLGAELTALNGRIMGFVHVFHHRRDAFAAADEAVLVHLAQMASAAIERSELYT